MFAPAHDTSNWSRPDEGVSPDPGEYLTLYDAALGTWVDPDAAPAGSRWTGLHVDGDELMDAVMGIRLDNWANAPGGFGNNATDYNSLGTGGSVLIAYSAGSGDAWRTNIDPTFLKDLANNQNFPPSLQFGVLKAVP